MSRSQEQRIKLPGKGTWSSWVTKESLWVLGSDHICHKIVQGSRRKNYVGLKRSVYFCLLFLLVEMIVVNTSTKWLFLYVALLDIAVPYMSMDLLVRVIHIIHFYNLQRLETRVEVKKVRYMICFFRVHSCLYCCVAAPIEHFTTMQYPTKIKTFPDAKLKPTLGTFCEKKWRMKNRRCRLFYLCHLLLKLQRGVQKSHWIYNWCIRNSIIHRNCKVCASYIALRLLASIQCHYHKKAVLGINVARLSFVTKRKYSLLSWPRDMYDRNYTSTKEMSNFWKSHYLIEAVLFYSA